MSCDFYPANDACVQVSHDRQLRQNRLVSAINRKKEIGPELYMELLREFFQPPTLIIVH